MQTNNGLLLHAAVENISATHLKITYRKPGVKISERQRIRTFRILKKSNVHTMEEVAFFEEMYGLVYDGFFARLSQRCPSLTTMERLLLAFTRMGIAEKFICRNMACSTEQIRSIRFSIGKKLNLDPRELPQTLEFL